MSIEAGGVRPVGAAADRGLVALATVLAMHRIAADPDQFRHSLGHPDPIVATDILRLAKRHEGVRARVIDTRFDRLARLPLPAIADGPDGWFVIGRVHGESVLIQQAGAAPERLDRAGLDAIWNGKLILIATREGVAGSAGGFDVRWFIPQIIRYRRLIGEVLLITLALNLALLQGLARTKAELHYMADGGLENELMKPLRAPSAMAAAAQSAAQLAEKIAAADWSGDGAFETPALYRKEMSIDAWGAGAFNAKREAMTI